MVWGCSIICSYVSSFWDCCVTIWLIELCKQLGLELVVFVSAKFLKFRGTNDNG